MIAASFLYPLRLHYRGQSVCQVYSSIIIFPALVSSLYLFFATRDGGVLTSRNIDIYFTPIGFGSFVATIESLFLVAICVSVLMVIFLGQKAKLTENLLYTCTGFSFLVLLLIVPNQIVQTSLFCIASLISSLFLINRTPEILSSRIIRDFFWQRLGDIFALCALFMTINQKIFNIQNVDISTFFLYLSVLSRIVSVALFQPLNDSNLYAFPGEDLFRKTVLCLGSIVLIINKLKSSFDHNLTIFFSTISLSILAISLFLILLSKSRSQRISNSFNAMIVAVLVSFFLQWHLAAFGLLGIWVTLGPLLLLASGQPIQLNNRLTVKSKFHNILSWLLGILGFFGFIIARTCSALANTFTTVISPIYSGFFFYYLPMILIGLVQIPLRIFYNGNIKRALIFASLLIGTYIFLWVK